MTRVHRKVHRLIWPILVLATGIGLALALYWRPPPANAAPPAIEERQ